MTTTSPDAVNAVRAYLDAVQNARRSGTDAAWAAVNDLMTADFEVRLAGFGGDETWLDPWPRDRWLARLQTLPWGRLRTETIRVVGDDRCALAEQISEYELDGQTRRKPVCFVFDVEHSRVRRISVYRNDFGRPS